MCGIAGILGPERGRAHEGVLRLMADAIAHRGPDDEGWYLDGPVGLANRRLAVIDVTPAGHQPMLSDDGRYVLVYNGEIYNFRELRDDLAHRGHKLRSHTDTEVVLHAGPHCM